MSTVAGKARSDDLNRVKMNILTHTDIIDIKGLTEKTKRGWKHTETGRLLCPLTLIDKFDEDQDE